MAWQRRILRVDLDAGPPYQSVTDHQGCRVVLPAAFLAADRRLGTVVVRGAGGAAVPPYALVIE